MTSKALVKPRFSLEGWRLKEWIKGNGKTIKEILKVVVPAMIGWVVTNSPEWTVLATGIGKLVLDTAEYYLKEKTE